MSAQCEMCKLYDALTNDGYRWRIITYSASGCTAQDYYAGDGHSQESLVQFILLQGWEPFSIERDSYYFRRRIS